MSCALSTICRCIFKHDGFVAATATQITTASFYFHRYRYSAMANTPRFGVARKMYSGEHLMGGAGQWRWYQCVPMTPSSACRRLVQVRVRIKANTNRVEVEAAA